MKSQVILILLCFILILLIFMPVNKESLVPPITEGIVVLEYENFEKDIPLDKFNEAYELCHLSKRCKGLVEIDNKYMMCLNYQDANVGQTQNNVWLKNESLINSNIENNESIGINAEPNSVHSINLHGTINIQNENPKDNIICLTDSKGKACLTSEDLYYINKLPLVYDSNQVICLNDKNNIPVCIDKTHLQMLSGSRKFKIKNINTKTNIDDKYIGKGTYTIGNQGKYQIDNSTPENTVDGLNLVNGNDKGYGFSIYPQSSSLGVDTINLDCAENQCIP